MQIHFTLKMIARSKTFSQTFNSFYLLLFYNFTGEMHNYAYVSLKDT